ncbi:MAG TPA: GspH/FimT family pseudopilin [Vicinamibacterales bacterium]|nr:GspH/FimT family pseudopilin [Vicinamibacterales bacterium]
MATLGELAVTVALITTATATAFPQVQAGLDDARVAGAARYLSSRLAETRMAAIQRSRHVAMRFANADAQYAFATYEDGNGNGVLGADIQRGIDRRIREPERLSDHFRNVAFGTDPKLTPIEQGDVAPGADPIRLGTGNSVSFNALGGATSGTLYLAGRNHTHYAVRVFGATGKIRVYRFNWRTATWTPL